MLQTARVSLKAHALQRKQVREAIMANPLEFVWEWDGGFFRLPIDRKLRDYIVSEELHSAEDNEVCALQSEYYATFDAGPALNLVGSTSFSFDDGVDKRSKGFGALYPALQAFSRGLQKSIVVRRRVYHALDPYFPLDVFETTISPHETLHSRRKYISGVVASALSVLASDKNVERALPYGSWTYGNPMPEDLDFLILVKSSEAYQQDRLVVDDDHIKLIPIIACQKPSPDDYERMRVDALLARETINALEKLIKPLRLRFDGCLVPEQVFRDPTCCDYHKERLGKLKKEYGKFWSLRKKEGDGAAS